LAIQNDWDSYPAYHRTNDLPGNLTIPMGEGILRMNAGVLAEGVGVTSASRIFADGFESGDFVVWDGDP
ncbi:MAG: hypothetical protein MI919_21995, partial [Holophagales bacterium]|nr:hypothetical protein [Holophagales bacterium]